ncbi:MAG: sugar phosphate isomerase/epimerase family protein [Verrucomicrobiota bacterium]|nr:sugar phosphate isomerase/epimerase family protein [Verrucomicrobiota bacterium]
MNHPAADAVGEIRWMSELGLDFIDLTLEPPGAAPASVDTLRIRRALEEHQMGVVGHTAYYLPIANPFESLRRAAVEELKLCLRKFAEIGAKWMNIHPDRHAPFHSRSFVIEKNVESLRALLPVVEETGVGIMLENTPGDFNDANQLGEILDAIPELGLHLDIGHCNLLVRENTANEIIHRYGKRLKHVHLHDNKGGAADLHLPLGTGTLNFENHLQVLKSSGYDATITLEVFSPDQHYLAHSRDVLRTVWNGQTSAGRKRGELACACV